MGVKGTVELEASFNRYGDHKIKKEMQVCLHINILAQQFQNGFLGKILLWFQLDGMASFDFDMHEIQRLFLNTYKQGYECHLYQSWYSLTVKATVTEELTGKKASGDKEIKFFETDVKLEFPSFNPKNFKPGLELVTLLKVSRANGELFNPERLQFMTIHVSTTYKSNKEITDTYVPSPEGIIVIRNQVPLNTTEITIMAEYKSYFANPVRTWFTATKSISPSSSYIQLSTPNSAVKSGDEIRCKVKSNFPMMSYIYLILGRGRIMYMDSKTLPNGKNDVEFSFISSSGMAPSARVVVYTIRKDGEVVVDGLTITSQFLYLVLVKVTVEFDTDTSPPGGPVELTATATPGSQVAFLAVDKSVLLMNKDNDLKRSQILKDLQSYVSGSGWFPWWEWSWFRPSGDIIMPMPVYGNDALGVFQNAGLITLTDCLVYSRSYPDYDRYGVNLRGIGGGGAGGSPFAVGESRFVAPVSRVRSFFPETWLWVDVNASSTGEAKVSAKAPDTITSWVASAFAISPKTGFGIGALKPELKVFQPFFISLDLPYSVVRGEEIAIKVLIFNYMERTQEVTVTFKASENWKAINYAGARGQFEEEAVDISQVVSVPAGGGKAIAFPIIPTKLGNIPLEVQALSFAASDAVRKNLLVEPEGIPQEYSYSLLIDLNTTSSFTKTLEVALPNTTVPGSSYVKASLMGDILGSSFNNLDNLLRMPYGCGEQNMLNFAPNVFILKYLTAVDQLTPAIKTKAEIYMEQGYQRQQSYRHRDGSYSAFGRQDREGSMWLTAFVVKSFVQAMDYTYIDPNSIKQSLTWIARKQNKDGSFPRVGIVSSGSIQGGLKGNVSLTAFVTIALAEAEENDFKAVNVSKVKAVRYLENNLENITKSQDVYTLAITTYALTLVNSGLSGRARSALLSMAIRKDGTMHWSNDKKKAADTATPYRPYYRPRSADIEITAYALLTLSLDHDIENGLPVVKWLSQQRNSLGGYASTQDTVLGIQAMSEFSSFIYSPSKNFKVELTHSEDKQFSKIFRVDKSNAMVLQQVVIPKVTGNIKVAAEGHGYGMLQIGVTYHVNKEPKKSNFEFTVKMIKEDDDEIEVQACATWQGEGDKSNMAVMELGVPSGFSPDEELANELLRHQAFSLKRIESQEKKLILYFDQIKKGNATCVLIRFDRTHAIGKAQPVPAVVYDYYKPENRAETLYMPEKLKDVDLCRVCPSCVNCKHSKQESPV